MGSEGRRDKQVEVSRMKMLQVEERMFSEGNTCPDAVLLTGKDSDFYLL